MLKSFFLGLLFLSTTLNGANFEKIKEELKACTLDPIICVQLSEISLEEKRLDALACPDGGISAGGSCWFNGARNSSCSEVCTGLSLNYKPATCNISEMDCHSLAASLGLKTGRSGNYSPGGCHISTDSKVYLSTGSCDAAQRVSSANRLCACGS